MGENVSITWYTNKVDIMLYQSRAFIDTSCVDVEDLAEIDEVSREEEIRLLISEDLREIKNQTGINIDYKTSLLISRSLEKYYDSYK